LVGSVVNDDREAPVDERCPYLGLSDDRELNYGFAHGHNTCWHTGKPLAIDLDYQSTTCLVGGYNRCPVYLNRTDHRKLARLAAEHHKPPNLRALTSLIVLLFVASLLSMGFTMIVVFGIAGRLIGSGAAGPTTTPPGYQSLIQSAQGELGAAIPDLLQSLLVIKPTDTPIPSITPSPVETETATPSPTPSLTETTTTTVPGTATWTSTLTSAPPTATLPLVNPTRTPTITLTLRPTATSTVAQATATVVPETPTLPAPTNSPTPTLTVPPPTATDAPPPPTPTEAPPPPPPSTSTPLPTEPSSPTP
jgi:hypothetical protein